MACTEKLYIQSATSLLEKVDKYNAIIEALEDQALNSAAYADTEEYSIDDGQVKIKTIYRTPTQIASTIEVYTKLRNNCLNQLNGRTFVFRNNRGLA